MKQRRKSKTKSVKSLKKKLDSLYSTYRRMSEADHQGFVRCFTCGKKLKWKQEAQLGHYISRNYSATRYLDKNCEIQDVSCNIFKSGAKDIFALNLVKKHGEGILQELNDLKNTIKNFAPYELEEKIAFYKDKIEELKKGKALFTN